MGGTAALKIGPAAPPSEEGFPPLGRALLGFGFLVVAEFFYSWAWYTVDVLRPSIQDSLRLTLTQAGSAYSAQAAGALIGAMALGQLADRFGRRRALVVVMIGYGASLIAGAMVASYVQLLLQRFVLGLFLGGIFPVVVGIYVGLFAGHVRGRLASVIHATASGAIAVLGLASGAVGEAGWKTLLWIGGVPPILLSLLVFVAVPAAVDRRAAAEEGAAPAKLPIAELFAPAVRNRTLMLAALTGLNFFAYQAYSGWLTTYFRDVRGLSAAARRARRLAVQRQHRRRRGDPAGVEAPRDRCRPGTRSDGGPSGPSATSPAGRLGCCRARSRTRPPDTTSAIRALTTSQPRSLLSMAKSSSARSRSRRCWSSQKRIAQTCGCFRARFAPRSRPSFHGRPSWKAGSSGEWPIARLHGTGWSADDLALALSGRSTHPKRHSRQNSA